MKKYIIFRVFFLVAEWLQYITLSTVAVAAVVDAAVLAVCGAAASHVLNSSCYVFISAYGHRLNLA